MFGRIWRVMRLDASLYDEVKDSAQFDRESWAIVLILALIAGLVGAAIAFAAGAAQLGTGALPVIAAFLGILLTTVIGFLVNVLVVRYAGKAFGGRGGFAEVRRSLAYAYSPFAVGLLPVVNVLALVWVLATSFVATRRTHALSTRNTVFVMVIAWVVQIVVQVAMVAVGRAGAPLLRGPV